MKKQYNKNSNGFFRISAFMIMIIISFVALLIVWQKLAITKLGFAIRENELKLEQLNDDKARLQCLIASMESPSNIQKLLAYLNLNLSQSKSPKVIKVKL